MNLNIRKLYKLGHFFNPAFKNGLNVTENDLINLTPNDKVVQDAIRSFQQFMILDFERLSVGYHQRGASCDGELCGATLKLFEVPRCGHPDFSLNTKVGNGSWPEPCQKVGITYSVDKTNIPSKFKDVFDEQILKFVVASYGKIGANLVPKQGGGQANIRISFKSFGGSTIGMAEFNSESCADSVFCNISSSFSPNVPTEADLLMHEIGHNMNLQHTRGGTMNPSIINRDNFTEWTPSDPSYTTLVRYFGGEPINPPIPVPKEPKVVLISYPANIDQIDIDFKNKDVVTKLAGNQVESYVLLSNTII